MRFLSYLRQLSRALRPRRGARPRKFTRRPQLECLESRTLLTVVPLGSWFPLGPTDVQAPGDLLGHAHGRVESVAPDPTNVNVAYAGSDKGGVWKTTDWLDPSPHWTPLTDDQSSPQLGAYNSLVVCPSQPNVLYATVWGPGGGILHSADAGASWNLLTDGGKFGNAHLSSLVVDPNNCNTLYVAVESGADGGGLYKSGQGGADGSWVNTTAGSHTGPVTDVVMDPTNSKVLYAGFTGDAVNSPAVTNGVYKTTTGGEAPPEGPAWVQVNGPFLNGLERPPYVGGAIRLAVARTDPKTIYATEFDTFPGPGTLGDGLPNTYATTNAGQTWTLLPPKPSGNVEDRVWHVLLAVDPNNAQTVFSNNAYQLWQSTTGGKNWTSASPLGTDYVGMTFDKQGDWVVNSDQGVFFSPDQGQTWFDKSGDLNVTEFYDFTPPAPGGGGALNLAAGYGVAQDHYSFLTGLGGSAWTYTSQGDEAGKVLVNPQNPGRLYGYQPLQPANFVIRSDDFGKSWVPITKGIDLSGVAATDYGLAYTVQHSFVMDPSNPSRLLLGTNKVYATTNAGDQWVAISGVLSPSTKKADQYITALAVAPSDGKVVYAGTADGRLFVTHSGGSPWTEVDSGLPLSGPVVSIQINPLTPTLAFLTTSSATGDRVWASTVFGTTAWESITGDLPAGLTPRTLAADWRYTPPALYLGTERGLYASTDGGTHWTLSGGGLPRADVQDLTLDPTTDNVYAATYGRGAWLTQAAGPAVGVDLVTSGSTGVGALFDLTVKALDSAGKLAGAYTGTVQFSSSDGLAGLPSNYTFTPADRGVHTFHGLVLRTPGTQNIVLSDTRDSRLRLTRGILVVAPPVPPSPPPGPLALNITSLVKFLTTRKTSKLARGATRLQLTLVGRSKQAPSGPLWLVLDGLPSGVRLRGASGVTRAQAPLGSPYVRLAVPTLKAKRKVVVTLLFDNPTGQAIRYTPRLLEGTGEV
jgi:hypothetical protein